MIGDRVEYKEWVQNPGERGKWEHREAEVFLILYAEDLSPGDLGHRVRAHTYNSKNKTARLSADARVFELTDMYAHRNGNIVLNHGSYYLKHDTEVEVLRDV